jgi:hypothetical protein
MGYSSKNDLQNNYAGNVPQQTNYGYSGAGVKKSSAVPMMMAGGVGLAAGAALGAGGYYAYSRMSNKNSNGHWQDQSWCRPDDDQTRTMTCRDCVAEEGNMNRCEPIDDCYQGGGCSYAMPGDTLRDDVMVAGFVPDNYVSPFTITITKVVGDDYTQSKICPTAQPDTGSVGAAWQKASSIQQSLFMTLTEMTVLDVTGQEPATANSAHHVGAVGLTHLLLVFVLGRFFFGSRRA